jgi:putative ribosome biogenesis GTPase RsgA
LITITEADMSSNQDIESYGENPDALAVGTPIGKRMQTGSRDPVCIPAYLRDRSVHIIGVAGVGKSTLMESMILDDVRHGEGVLVLDPHGAMTSRLNPSRQQPPASRVSS